MLRRFLKSLFRRGRAAPPMDEAERALRAAADLSPAFLAGLRAASSAPGGDLPAPRPGARAIVLASCDPDYFRHFAIPFADSLAKNAGAGVALRLEIAGPDRWIDEEAAALAAANPMLDIACVAVPIAAGAAGDAARTFYACARFRALPAWLRRHRLPVLVSDLDVLVTAPLGDALSRHAGADAVVAQGRGDAEPWTRIAPSPLLVRPTPGGIAFAELAAAYVAHFLARGVAPWGLDRVAIAAARADAERRAPPSHVVVDGNWPLGPSLDHDPAAVTTPAFRAHLPRLRRVFGWTLPGTDMFFPMQLAHSAVLLGRPTWEGPMLEACLALCARRRRALDIGAHVGFWSHWLAHHFERVEAFEPQPILQECLRANVPAANLRLHAVALGNRSGTVAGALDPRNTGMSHLVDAPGGDIRLEPLDRYAFDEVDFIKLDAEGYELFVLQGAVDTLRRNRPLLLVEQAEWSARYGLAPDAALAFLASMGARVLRRMSKTDYLVGWDSADAWREPPARS